MFWHKKKKLISELRTLPFSELKKRTRIIVIDDDPNSFPIETIKQEGYAIEQWECVRELSKLDEGYYDIIFLDIQGVDTNNYTDEDGLGVLEHIKNTNPSQIVVAFSGQSFDLSKNRFWKLADDSLCKPVQTAKCKEIIDRLIETNLTPSYYWKAIKDILKTEGLGEKKILEIEQRILSDLKNKNIENLRSHLNNIISNTELAAKITKGVIKIVALLP